ncbi:hypothetical protein [Blautia obeum]|uniref:hypothetical protein n=1 Tax=Blautia obeum TaxID=40520 RepID=UPI00156E618B|nr:hypothetical protein [Blautia obeum]NSJ36534.1 hypothetical protein [Blautia obeum]
MRRKQLYAIILAGALAASSAPAAVFAAEGDVAATAETSEENPVDGETAAATEAPAEETPADTTAATEAPAEQAPAQEAAAATEAPAQEAAPSEQTQQTTEETPAVQETPAAETSETTETEGETEELAPGETTDQTAISITLKATEEGQEDKVRYFDTLQHAIDAAPEYNAETNRGATVIEVSGQIELENTVTVKANKKVCIRATNAVTISRKAGTLTADMFQVSGENAELQFDVKEGAENASLTVSGSLDEANTQVVDGSIVKVSEKGAFGIGTGVTLKDNNTSADGGAITNKDGNVVLYGGTITGNTGVKGGGIYTNTSINVQGTVVVNENKRGTEVSNICLDGATTMINVTDVLTGSDISFAHLNEADALTVVKAGVNSAGTALTADNFKTVIDANDESNSQIKYENKDAYTLNLAADNLSAVLKKTEPVDPNPNPNPNPDPDSKPDDGKDDTKKESDSFKSEYKITKWVDYSSLKMQVVSNKNCTAYFTLRKKNNTVSAVNTKTAKKVTLTAGKAQPLNMTLPGDSEYMLVGYYVFSDNSNKLESYTITGRPEKVRDPEKHTVDECTVTGLESPLKFYPKMFYEFSATGAGQNSDKTPVTGDEKYVPLYWSTHKNPTAKQQNKEWKIGSAKGISEAGTYTMYVFFQKYTYKSDKWVEGKIESKAVQFQAAEITKDEWENYETENNITPVPYNGDDTGSGDDADAELTATAEASEKDAGSKSKSAVSTADESPIGTMSALAALSLLAGGYIVVRKRKKEEQ